ncbi:MAG: glutathione S-transferase [Robiginitomaculum sp.]
MITVHHLNNSRSQRILWLLEELGLNYEIRHYARDSVTNLAPKELMAIHPLGKSPVITDGDLSIAETGAIVEYIIRTYGKGKLIPAANSNDFNLYTQFLHASEGSVMLPILLSLYVGFLGEAGAPLHPKITQEMKTQLDYLEYHLVGHEYFAGAELTGADIMMIFPLEAARARGRLKVYPSCAEYVDKIHKRPAYIRAVERGGEYAYGPKS